MNHTVANLSYIKTHTRISCEEQLQRPAVNSVDRINRLFTEIIPK